MDIQVQLRSRIENELIKRQKRNSAYSLRAYARDLEVTAPLLCHFLKRKRLLPFSVIQKVVFKLDLSQHQIKSFLAQAESKLTAVLPQDYMLPSEHDEMAQNWHFWAIRSLTMTKDFKSDPGWIAGRLGISPLEAQQALTSLLELGLIKETEGTLKSSDDHVFIPDSQGNQFIQNFHRQSLSQAQEFIGNNIPHELKDFLSMTFSLNTQKVPLLKDRLRKFTNELASLVADDSSDEVYRLGFYFFPLTKTEGAKMGGETTIGSGA